jgi:hypothetical protein
MANIHGIFRASLLALGVVSCPADDVVLAFAERLETHYPDPALMSFIYNLTAPEWSNRFVFQSANSVSILGEITHRRGGAHEQFIKWDDVWEVTSHFSEAFVNRGELQGPVVCRIEYEREGVSCFQVVHLRMVVHPQHVGLLGVVVEGTSGFE